MCKLCYKNQLISVLAYDYAMVLRTFSLFGFALGIPAAVTERTAATLLISDYEFRTRRYIPGGIILVVFIVITTTTCARFLCEFIFSKITIAIFLDFTTLFPIIAAYFLVNCFALMVRNKNHF